MKKSKYSDIELTSKDKIDILQLYYQGKTYEEIAKQYAKKTNQIKLIIDEMKKEKSELDSIYQDIPLDEIIEKMENGASLNQISKSYYLNNKALIKLLERSKEGMHALNAARTRAQNKKKNVPLKEIEEAFLDDNFKEAMAELEKKYNVSSTTLRKRLVEEYGFDYKEKLKPDYASQLKKQTKKRKKVLSRNQFFESVKTFPLEDLLAEAKRRNIEVPKEYVEEYRENNLKPKNPNTGTFSDNMDEPNSGGEER